MIPDQLVEQFGFGMAAIICRKDLTTEYLSGLEARQWFEIAVAAGGDIKLRNWAFRWMKKQLTIRDWQQLFESKEEFSYTPSRIQQHQLVPVVEFAFKWLLKLAVYFDEWYSLLQTCQSHKDYQKRAEVRTVYDRCLQSAVTWDDKASLYELWPNHALGLDLVTTAVNLEKLARVACVQHVSDLQPDIAAKAKRLLRPAERHLRIAS